MRVYGMHALDHIVAGSDLNVRYRRHGGIARLGAAQRVFAAVAGARLRENAAVVAVEGKRLVIAASGPAALEHLHALEPVLIPAMARQLTRPAVEWVNYIIDPNAHTPTTGAALSREHRVAGTPPPEVVETAARLPAGPLRERFAQWMTLTMESGKERL